VTNTTAGPPIARAITATNAAIRGFDFQERSSGA
jgi:hypothetical protein